MMFRMDTISEIIERAEERKKQPKFRRLEPDGYRPLTDAEKQEMADFLGGKQYADAMEFLSVAKKKYAYFYSRVRLAVDVE